MRYFNGLLFHGEPGARTKVEFLRERFQKALEMQAGLQQPDHAESQTHHEALTTARARDIDELHDMVADLVAALLGRELTPASLEQLCPYPWDETALRAALWPGLDK